MREPNYDGALEAEIDAMGREPPSPMRDTATLLELLEAERAYWLAEMESHRIVVDPPRWHEAMEAAASITHLIRVTREEASRGTA